VTVVTFFEDWWAREKREENFTLARLGTLIAKTSGAKKDHLPWLKVARFGERRTQKGSLRHDANVTNIGGIEAD